MNFLNTQEEALIGRLVISPELVDNLGLVPEHFLNKYAGDVYGAILHLSNLGKSVNEVTVVNYLADGNKEAESSWYTFLSRACANASYLGQEESIASVIREEYTKRQAALVTSEASRLVLESHDAGDVIEETIRRLESIQNLGNTAKISMYDEALLALSGLNDIVSDSFGLPTGVGLECEVPGGIPRDKVTVLFGETGTFKTTLKSNIIDAIAKNGGKVLDFSLEDSNALTTQRALARISGVPYSRLVNGELSKQDKEKLLSLDNELSYLQNITVIGDIPPTADEIIRAARQYKKEGLAAVVIDYITLLDWGKNSERTMLNDAMLKFQRAAKRDNVAYIVVSQINDERLHERGRADARPILRDLFGSSAIRTACKLAVATYRPGKYGPPKNKYDKEIYGEIYALDPEVYNNIIELWVRKNIVGEDNVPVYVLCDRKTGKMKPISVEALL